MITIFNRRELTITWDQVRQAEIRSILSSHGIESMVKIVDFHGSSRYGHNAAGTIGLNRSYLYAYKIYVRSKDYEEAEYLIRR
ncbi:MAG: hypothetical protein ACI3WQ_05875 [Faecousia sp.]